MKKAVNKKEVIPAGMDAARASSEYRPKKIRSVNSITVIAPMLTTRGRLILRISLYLAGIKEDIFFTIMDFQSVFLQKKHRYHLILYYTNNKKLNFLKASFHTLPTAFFKISLLTDLILFVTLSKINVSSLC